MIYLSSSVASLDEAIPFSGDFMLDLQWWQEFATLWNGRSIFLLPDWTPSPHLQLFTDSSATTGFGANCQGEWFNGRWSTAQLEQSIQWKELYPIVLAAAVRGKQWRTLRICLFCDNQAIVHCLASGSSCCPHVMSLLCTILLLAAKYNFTMSAQHIPATHNVIANSLSRFRMQNSGRVPGAHQRVQDRPVPLWSCRHSAPIWRPVPLCSHCPGHLPSDPRPHRMHSVLPPDSCSHVPETQTPNQRPGLALRSRVTAVLISLLPHRSCLSSSRSWHPRLEDPSPGPLEQ